MHESHQHLLLYSETLNGDIQYFGLQQKNIFDKCNYMTIKDRKKKKVLVHRFCEDTTTTKKRICIKYQVEVWTAYAEQQNAMNIT